MSWYWWVLVWIVLVVASAGFMAAVFRSLDRQAKALAVELSEASQRLAAVSEGLQVLSERAADPAVFTPATQLRQERFLAARRRDSRHSAVPGTDRRRSAKPTQQRVR